MELKGYYVARTIVDTFWVLAENPEEAAARATADDADYLGAVVSITAGAVMQDPDPDVV